MVRIVLANVSTVKFVFLRMLARIAIWLFVMFLYMDKIKSACSRWNLDPLNLHISVLHIKMLTCIYIYIYIYILLCISDTSCKMNIKDINVELKLLSTVVLNSRDWQGKVWLPKKHAHKTNLVIIIIWKTSH